MLIAILGLLFLSAEGLDLGHLKSRMMGGTRVTDAIKYPFVASVQNSTGHHCGGLIISKTCILTNGACSLSAEKNTTVVVGTNDLESGGTRYKVVAKFQPPGYNGSNHYKSIGIIRLASPIKFSKEVCAIRLDEASPKEGSSCKLIGWGVQSYPSTTMSRFLYEIILEIISHLVCKRKSKPQFPLECKFCTKNRPNYGPCSGDFGSPCVCGKKVCGVHSTSVECATGYPDTFEVISCYIPWIKSICDIKDCPE